MGLDMYLEKHIFIGGVYDEEIAGVCIIKHGKIHQQGREIKLPVNRIASITLSTGYWRKAYAIHWWFVEHCFDGEPEHYDGREIYVDEEDLHELLDCAKAVRDDHSLARQLLPSPDGSYEGWYWEDIEETIRIMNKAIEEYDIHDRYMYSASW